MATQVPALIQLSDPRVAVQLVTTNAHVHNYNTREFACIHTFKVKHEFAKKFPKYNLPKLIDDTPERVKYKINKHSLKGFINYRKNDMIHKYRNTCIILS